MKLIDAMKRTGITGTSSQYPVYTLSGAGSTVVNGDYYLYDEAVESRTYKKIGDNDKTIANDPNVSGDWVLYSGSFPTDKTDANVYYSWTQTGASQLIIIPTSNEVVQPNGTASFPTIADA